MIFCPYGDNPYKRVGCDFLLRTEKNRVQKSLKNEFYLV